MPLVIYGLGGGHTHAHTYIGKMKGISRNPQEVFIDILNTSGRGQKNLWSYVKSKRRD